MKTEKLSLKRVKNALSRGEMKKIMAGSGGGPDGGGGGCSSTILPPATFYCHDSTGYILGTMTSSCCSNTATALQLCENATYPEYTSYVTGPC
ncbi:MAG: hypothetical protein M3N14_01220 [Bacteroidota bacterium]|nr:hypothetical protein [Bacteroidota bacterium]